MRGLVGGLAALLLVAVGGLVLSSDAGAYTTAEINTRLKGGVTTAYNFDNQCRDVLRNAGRSTFNSDLRNVINNARSDGGASYKSDTWISQGGQPSVVTPLTVDAGAPPQDLQINYLTFLCASLVQPDFTNGCRNLAISGNDLVNRSPWLTPTDARDVRPNPWGSSCQYPARTGTYRQIENPIRVYNNDTGQLVGQITLPASELRTDIRRDDNSRYWFGRPVRFDFRPNAGFQTSMALRFELRFREIADYSTGPGGQRCNLLPSGGSGAVGDFNFRACEQRTGNYRIYINVRSYGLTPTISINQATGDVGSSHTVSSRVTKTGNANPTATWRVTRLVYDPGASVAKGGGNSGDDPCGFFGGEKSCDSVFDAATVFNSNKSRSDTGSLDDSMPPGTQVCYANSVSRPTQAATPVWRHSSLACVIVGKKPKVQVWGGDLRTRGLISASTSQDEGKLYGSWGEYGVLSRGVNALMGSGSGLSGGVVGGATGAAAAGWSGLTFANSNAPPYGNYALLGARAPLHAQLSARASSGAPSSDVGSLASGTYKTGGSLTLGGATLGAGRSVVIAAAGTITITGDITYAGGPYTSVGQLPQLILVANTININDSVKRLDAWLVASGTVNTCANQGATASLTSAKCRDQLVVNGPVTSSKLVLNRTAGSEGGDPGQAGEVFNLRPDTYLWAYGQGLLAPKAQTTYVTELPPRF